MIRQLLLAADDQLEGAETCATSGDLIARDAIETTLCHLKPAGGWPPATTGQPPTSSAASISPPPSSDG
jgi:hypothetical protein